MNSRPFILNSVLPISLSFFLFSIEAYSQNTIYGLTKRPGMNKQLYMSTIEPFTGVVTLLSGPLPVQHLGVGGGMNALDYARGLYYFGSPGSHLNAVDIYSGNLFTSTQLTLHNCNLSSLQFNCIDSSVYAIKSCNNYNSYAFGKFDVNAGTFYNTPTLIPTYAGENRTFDKANNRYIYCGFGHTLHIINIATGVMDSVVMPIAANKTFNFIEYNCYDSCLYGLQRNNGTFTGYLFSKFDLRNNSYTVLSSNIIWGGQLGAGRLLDIENGIYYVNAGNQMLPIRISDGVVLPSLPYTYSLPGTFSVFYIQQTSDCDCKKSSSVSTYDIEDISFQFTNPVFNELNINSNTNQTATIKLFDLTSRMILQQEFVNSVSININHLPKGIYILSIDSKKYHSLNKILKQ
jgi:hypothetical protein